MKYRKQTIDQVRALIAWFLFVSSVIAQAAEITLPERYRDLTIRQVETTGISVPQVRGGSLPADLQNIFLGRRFSADLLETAKDRVKQVYQGLGYPYVYLDNVFMKYYRADDPSLGAVLTIKVRENPVSRVQVQGTHRKKSILQILQVPLGSPYNTIEMEGRTQALFASDLFNRYFRRVTITPYYLEDETMLLGIYVYEKKATRLSSGASDAGSQQIAAWLGVNEPALYGTKNQASLKGAVGFFERLTSWQAGLAFTDLYNLQETNRIRYQLEAEYSDHGNLNQGYEQFRLNLYYAYHFKPGSFSPVYWGFAYQWFNRDQQGDRLNYHFVVSRLYYNTEKFEIYSLFHNFLLLDGGYALGRTGLAEDEPQRTFFAGHGKLWYKPLGQWWLKMAFDFYHGPATLRFFRQGLAFARWDLLSNRYLSSSLSWFYRDDFFLIGPFAESLWLPGHNLAGGVSLYLVWLNFISRVNAGYRAPTRGQQNSDEKKEFFGHVQVNATF